LPSVLHLYLVFSYPLPKPYVGPTPYFDTFVVPVGATLAWGQVMLAAVSVHPSVVAFISLGPIVGCGAGLLLGGLSFSI